MSHSKKNLQALVISLKHSTERQKKIESEMQKTSLKWRFLDACDGEQLDFSLVAYDAQKVKRLLGYELTKKEVGCYLSHMNCWHACVEANENVLIFEDDFVVQENFNEVLQRLMIADFSWDIIRIQALAESSFKVIQDFGSFRLVENESDPLGATAYLVNPRSASILIRNSREIFEPLDHFIEHKEKHGLKMLAIDPYPIKVFDPTRATSTITDRPERPSVKGFRKVYRSCMRAIDRMTSKNPWFPKIR
ncbi:MAG: glycosyltransferase family 25 protein [Rhodoferax sp.]|nr:glycosyltransferase family 25 protein [Rhodoferax sp.]